MTAYYVSLFHISCYTLLSYYLLLCFAISWFRAALPSRDLMLFNFRIISFCFSFMMCSVLLSHYLVLWFAFLWFRVIFCCFAFSWSHTVFLLSNIIFCTYLMISCYVVISHYLMLWFAFSWFRFVLLSRDLVLVCYLMISILWRAAYYCGQSDHCSKDERVCISCTVTYYYVN